MAGMIELDDEQAAAREWFEALRGRICAEFEAIEREAGSDAAFEYTPWDRTDEDPGSQPGRRARTAARVRLCAATCSRSRVNVSTVAGRFSPDFAAHPRRGGG